MATKPSFFFPGGRCLSILIALAGRVAPRTQKGHRYLVKVRVLRMLKYFTRLDARGDSLNYTVFSRRYDKVAKPKT